MLSLVRFEGPIEAALELPIDVERAFVREGQHPHHDHSGDAGGQHVEARLEYNLYSAPEVAQPREAQDPVPDAYVNLSRHGKPGVVARAAAMGL
jgi:hypothetical protein